MAEILPGAYISLNALAEVRSVFIYKIMNNIGSYFEEHLFYI